MLTPEERDEIEAQLRYIKSRPKSKHPLHGLMLDTNVKSVEFLRVNVGGLPGPVEATLRKLRAEHADDPEILDAIAEMQNQDNPCAVARRDHAALVEKTRFNMIQLEAAMKGFLWRDGEWVDVRETLPRGIPNRFSRR